MSHSDSMTETGTGLAGVDYDSLTGLSGMNRFFELAPLKRDEYLAEGKDPVAVYFDLNGMKEFNMKFGFAEGDKLIRAMADVLIKHFGRECCGRFGGDRFTVVSCEDRIAEQIKAVFEECLSINEGKNLPLRVGIYKHSIGAVGPSTAFDRAKMACDVNRGSYVSRFAFFSTDMLAASRKKNHIIENFDRALKEGWVQVYYQPLIRSANSKVCDEEALARWIDPEKGFLSPADFIPVLEETKLIYKLDLYVTEQILKKFKIQDERGLYAVPCSVNVSRADFESCDIVEEIRKRVDDAGVSRERLTIEITESAMASDFEYMKKQVERFKELGFKVWMDDYGSGYSSPVILQKIKFDTIKLDMGFLAHFDDGNDSRVIISSLVKMAMGLGIDTVVEGVETEEQAEFLKVIGCSMLQGYHFCKPIPLSTVLGRYEKGEQIGFENPGEVRYYSEIGSVNLYDMSFSADGEGRFEDYFDTMPMAIIEVKAGAYEVIRSNRPYLDFIKDYISNSVISADIEAPKACRALLKSLKRCADDGKQMIIALNVGEGKKLHILLRRIAENPVSKAKAVMLVILSIADEGQDLAISYDSIARTLSADFMYLYHVDLRTDRFVEYSLGADESDMSVERRGDDFFNAARTDAMTRLYEGDRDYFIKAFTRENVLSAIDEHGSFKITYRLLINGQPVYMDMKALRMGGGNRYIVIGVNNVDARMKQQDELERMNEERIIYSRIMALSGNYICFYTVDPENDYYMSYHASGEFYDGGWSIVGTDFFKDAYEQSEKAIFEDDLELFRRSFSKDKVMKQIEKNGIFTLTYRMKFGDKVKYVLLKVACVTEYDRKQLVVGLLDIDERKKREREYALKLAAARNRVHLDELTGVKDKHAYVDVESEINTLIQEGNATPFALILLDIIGLKKVNDAKGHDAGDDHLKEGCRIVCDVFHHSPVYRVGGDEFVVIATGRDYDQIDVLMDHLLKKNKANKAKGGVMVAGGAACYSDELSVEDLFRRADEAMHKNKEELSRI